MRVLSHRGVVDRLRGSGSRAIRPGPRADAGQPLASQDEVRLDALVAIAARLTTAFERSELLDTIAAVTNRLLGADFTTIRILTETQYQVVAWAGIDAATAARLPLVAADDGWYGSRLLAVEPWTCEDVRALADRRWYDRYEGVVAFRSHTIVPLLHAGRAIGALTTSTSEPRVWSRDDLAFLASLAANAAIAVHNSELFERVESRAAQLAVVQAASARMNAAMTIEAVGRAIVEELRRLVDYHNARVYLLEEPDELVPIAFEGRVGAYERVDLELLRTKLGAGFSGWVGLHGEPLLVHDAKADPRGSTIPGTDDVDESMLVVPMRYDGAVSGVITLSKLGLHQFGPDDLRLLTIVADQAATAVASARLVDQSETLAAELRRLLDLSNALTQSLDTREVANVLARHLALALAVDECTVSWWDRPASRVITLGAYPSISVVDRAYDLAEFPETRRVLEERTTSVVVVDDQAADQAERQILRAEGRHVLAMFPLIAKGNATGLVELTASDPVRFDDGRLRLARTMANEAAVALENARLYEQARSLADRDPLTGFFNHRYLHERLGEEIVRAQRSRRPLSLLMLDLDDFKLVNDTFGHLFGDRVLVWVAEIVKGTLRASDVPARYGGDEFAIILPDADPAAAEAASARIVDALRDHPFEGEGRGPVPVDVCVGAATYGRDGRSPTELIGAADRRLYDMKRRLPDGGAEGTDLADGAAATVGPEAVTGTAA